MKRYKPVYKAEFHEDWMKRVSDGDYVLYEEASAIIAEKDKEIARNIEIIAWRDTTINALKLQVIEAESKQYPDYDMANVIDALQEQLRASNEALVAAQFANKNLRDAFENVEGWFLRGELKSRGQIPHYETMVGDLTTLAVHDKEVRAKALEDAGYKFRGQVAYNFLFQDSWFDGSYLKVAEELAFMSQQIREGE